MAIRIMSLRLNRLLLYVAAAIAASVLLVWLLLSFWGGSESSAEASYYPGTYTTSVPLPAGSVTVEMTFSESGIESVRYDIPESVQSVYPLVQPTATSIGDQLAEGTQLEAVQFDSASSETASHLLKAIRMTADKARKQ